VSSFTSRFAPHLALAGLCLGLAASNLVQFTGEAGALLAGVALVIAGVVERGRVVGLTVALGVVGAVWGSARLEAIDRSPLAGSIGHAGHVRAVVTGPARRSPFDLRVPATTESFGVRRIREPVLLKLPLGRAPPQGAVVDVLAEVREPRGPQNGFDERAYLRRHGIHVVLRSSHLRILGRRGGVAGAADRLRAHISRTMAPGLTGERRAVVAGVVLGEDEGLSRDLADAFRASGLYHLLAVSGQNVLVIGGGMLVLALLLGVPRWVGELGAIAAILGYLAAVGWQPSVVRAGIAGLLTSLAWLTARPRDRWYFLLAGAAVLLAWSPYALLDPGFQLSFSAVAAIFLGAARVGSTLEGYPLPRIAAEAITLSLVCGLATAPVLLSQFGTVPVYSVPANVLAAPAVAPLLWCGLSSAAIHPVLPAACGPLAWIEGVLAAYVAGVARVVGGLPFARLGVSGALMAACAAVIVVVAVRRGALRGLLRPL
jgi:competence protein ComEC